ncbi:MAG: nitrate ABC transporter substrate-binding protein, partial [Bacteroidota bacterium]
MKNTYFTLLGMLLLAGLFQSCGSDAPATAATPSSAPASAQNLIEKPQLTFGFIKLTDMAPL